jgi:hypothetical protein
VPNTNAGVPIIGNALQPSGIDITKLSIHTLEIYNQLVESGMKMDLLPSDAFARILTHSALGLSREAVYIHGCGGCGMVLATALLGMHRSSGFTKLESATCARTLAARFFPPPACMTDGGLRTPARCESFPPAPPARMTDGGLRTPARCESFSQAPPARMTDGDLRSHARCEIFPLAPSSPTRTTDRKLRRRPAGPRNGYLRAHADYEPESPGSRRCRHCRPA